MSCAIMFKNKIKLFVRGDKNVTTTKSSDVFKYYYNYAVVQEKYSLTLIISWNPILCLKEFFANSNHTPFWTKSSIMKLVRLIFFFSVLIFFCLSIYFYRQNLNIICLIDISMAHLLYFFLHFYEWFMLCIVISYYVTRNNAKDFH